MSNPDRSRRLALTIAVSAFTFPLYAFLRWLAVYDTAAAFDQNVNRFLAGFPALIRSTSTITWSSAAACGVAALAGIIALRRSAGRVRGVIGVLVGLATLMGLWNLFTLM